MQLAQEKRPFGKSFQVSELSDKERFSQESGSYLASENDSPQLEMAFDPAARVDMIDRALEQHCYDTEQSDNNLDDESASM